MRHTPISDFEIWKGDLDQFGDLGITGDDPTLVIGDFNASFWHPNFRALLDKGFTDAHIALRRGLSVSWPTDVWYPPFVRLDHALTTDSLVPTGIEDFDIRRQRSPRADRHRFASSLSSARNARPRCDSSCFASGPISANVRPSPSSGTKIAS